jgi:copper chaperone
MDTLRFKTNLKCSGCIAAITPGLKDINGIDGWKVDLTSPDRTLEVETTADKAGEILEVIKKAGYKISQL